MSDLQPRPVLRGTTSSDAARSVPALSADSSDAIDFAFYSAALGQSWKLLLAGSLIGAFAGLATASFRPLLYEGSTTLVVTAAPGSNETSVNTGSFRPFLENLTAVSEVVTDLRLSGPPENLTPQRFISERLDIEEVRGTNVLKIRTHLRNAEQAAEAARRLARKATAISRDVSQIQGASLRDQLKTHLDQAAARLQTAETALLTFKQQAQVELLKEDADAMLTERGELLDLTIRIEAERARLQAAEAELTRHERVLSVPRAVGAENALQRAAANESAGVAAEANDKNAVGRSSTDKQSPEPKRRAKPTQDPGVVDPLSIDQTAPFINPVYQTLEFQIATSRSRLASLERQRREMVEVRKLGGTELAKLTELYGRQAQLARLQSNYDVANRIHTELVVRYEQAGTAAVAVSPQLQIVDDAVTPDRPVSRRRVASAAVGLTAGLLGVALFIVLQRKAQKA